MIYSLNIPFDVPDDILAIIEVFQEILDEKIIKKNQQYGNSIMDPALIFNDIEDPSVLIGLRVDDKLARLKSLDKNSPKYLSELKEIVAYLLWLIHSMEGFDSDEDNSSGYQRE